MARRSTRTPTTTQSPIAEAVHLLCANLDALRAYVRTVSPHVDKAPESASIDPTARIAIALAFAELLPPEAAAAILSPEKTAAAKEKYGHLIEIRPKHSKRGKASREVSLKLTPEQGSSLAKGLRELQIALAQRQLLLRTSLIALVSMAESTVAQLVRHAFGVADGLLDKDSKRFSLADLSTFAGLSDAREAVVTEKTEELLYSSFSDWLGFFRKQLGLTSHRLDELTPAVVEVFERRHLLIHHDGVVSRKYMRNVPERLRVGTKIGDLIPVSSDYLSNAIALVERFFLLLAFALWRQLHREDKRCCEVCIHRTYTALCDERYTTAEELARWGEADNAATQEERWIQRMNLWQSIKWQDRFQEVEDAVRSADLSAMRGRYQLVKYALLGDVEAARSSLPRLLRSKEVAREEVLEWPVFKELRTDERIQAILDRHTSKQRGAKRRANETAAQTSTGALADAN